MQNGHSEGGDLSFDGDLKMRKSAFQLKHQKRKKSQKGENRLFCEGLENEKSASKNRKLTFGWEL
jgi:hypothetical protein